MQATIRNFLKLEAASGIVLMGAAVLAMIVANTPLKDYYDLLLEVPVEIRVGGLQIAKPLILWVNDGLMAVFFFLIGLELKREVVEGELSRPANVLLPALGALGGIIVPVAIYVWFNKGDAAGMQGWAIPAATDIAFALGILMLIGSRVPISLKVFLVSVAIFDDLGAIAIIALFYTSELSMLALLVARRADAGERIDRQRDDPGPARAGCGAAAAQRARLDAPAASSRGRSPRRPGRPGPRPRR